MLLKVVGAAWNTPTFYTMYSFTSLDAEETQIQSAISDYWFMVTLASLVGARSLEIVVSEEAGDVVRLDKR